jgi:hypothetical protein
LKTLPAHFTNVVKALSLISQTCLGGFATLRDEKSSFLETRER